MSIEKSKSIRNIAILAISILIGLVACVLTIFFAAGGDGTYLPAIIMFPYWMISLELFGKSQVLAVISLLLFFPQYPLYGVFIIYSDKKGIMRKNLKLLTTTHCLSSIIAFLFSLIIHV